MAPGSRQKDAFLRPQYPTAAVFEGGNINSFCTSYEVLPIQKMDFGPKESSSVLLMADLKTLLLLFFCFCFCFRFCFVLLLLLLFLSR